MEYAPLPALILFMVSAFTCSVLHGQTRPFNSAHFNLQELAPGVWAAVNNDSGGHAICNAGIVDLGDRTLVFDPFMNIDAATDLRRAAETLAGRPVSIVVNSHFHNDHIRGNQVFGQAAVIGTGWTRERIAVSEPKELAWETKNAKGILESYRKQAESATGVQKEEIPMWIAYFEGMVENSHRVVTTLPNLVFNDSLRIHGTRRDILLVEYRNGHTGSDVIMLLTTDHIVFAGGLLFNVRHAWIGDGDPDAWTGHLQGWSLLPESTRFVPGHGQPGDMRIVQGMIEYLTTLKGLVAAYPKGTPDSTITSIPVPDRFKDWKLRRFHPMNLAFLWERRKAGDSRQ
jgi:glyoxylase-like metal-dependent hydrolase (beta-lactamase superfamily II)